MSKYIRVTKANRERDRGIIAKDAVCAAFENKNNRATSILTMDGFWYDVVETIEYVAEQLEQDKDIDNAPVASKKDYYRAHKTMSPFAGEEKIEGNDRHESDVVMEEEKLPIKPIVIKGKGYGKPYKKSRRRLSRGKNFSSGDGERHHEVTPQGEME